MLPQSQTLLAWVLSCCWCHFPHLCYKEETRFLGQSCAMLRGSVSVLWRKGGFELWEINKRPVLARHSELCGLSPANASGWHRGMWVSALVLSSHPSLSARWQRSLKSFLHLFNWFHFTPQMQCLASQLGTKPCSANSDHTKACKDKWFWLIPLLVFSECNLSCPNLNVIQLLMGGGAGSCLPGAACCLMGRGDLPLPHHRVSTCAYVPVPTSPEPAGDSSRVSWGWGVSGVVLDPVWQLRVGFWALLEAENLLPWASKWWGQEWIDRMGQEKVRYFFHPPICKRESLKLAWGLGSFAG